MNVVGKQVEGKRINTVALEEGITITVERIPAGLWMTTHVDTIPREELQKRDPHVLLFLDLFVNNNDRIREPMINKLRVLGFAIH